MKIGVLALQGAFREHINKLRQIGVEAVEVRLPGQLAGLDGLIIPGGESTTMAKIADAYALLPPLRAFRRQKPVWGTCAGLIMLADGAQGQKQGGQTLLGGLDIVVARNYFGRQVASFEIDLSIPALGPVSGPGDPQGAFHAIFIRAPAIVAMGKMVETLASLPDGVVVAVRQGKLLGTAFHPELSDDLRFHRYFATMVSESGTISGNGRRAMAAHSTTDIWQQDI